MLSLIAKKQYIERCINRELSETDGLEGMYVFRITDKAYSQGLSLLICFGEGEKDRINQVFDFLEFSYGFISNNISEGTKILPLAILTEDKIDEVVSLFRLKGYD